MRICKLTLGLVQFVLEKKVLVVCWGRIIRSTHEVEKRTTLSTSQNQLCSIVSQVLRGLLLKMISYVPTDPRWYVISWMSILNKVIWDSRSHDWIHVMQLSAIRSSLYWLCQTWLEMMLLDRGRSLLGWQGSRIILKGHDLACFLVVWLLHASLGAFCVILKSRGESAGMKWL